MSSHKLLGKISCNKQKRIAARLSVVEFELLVYPMAKLDSFILPVVLLKCDHIMLAVKIPN